MLKSYPTRHRQPTRTAGRLVLGLVALALVSVTAAPGYAGRQPADPGYAIANVAADALPLNPARERRWTLMRAWARGATIDREPSMNPAFSEGELAEFGGRLFSMYCVNCHGDKGDGTGPRSAVFGPAGPRNLTKGVFKFRSTESGEPPTPEDLFRTISGGLRGTGMVPFADLPEMQRWALVAYVRKLAGIAEDTLPAEIDIPAPPASLDAAVRVSRGQQVYRRLECAKCHGSRGRGDGPAAAGLEDQRGKPAPVPDFAVDPLKRGNSPKDIYCTVVSGLDGTPMPGYLGTAPNSDLWDLVAFVRSLQRDGSAHASAQEVLAAKAHVDAMAKQGVHAVAGGCGCQAGK